MDDSAKKKIVKARSQLLLHKPMYGALSAYLNLKEVPDGTFEEMGAPGRIGTDGNNLLYEPEAIHEKGQKELQATIAHEVMHLGLGHLWRKGERNSMRWNVATDYVINNMLDNEGLGPKTGLVNHDFDNMSAEEVYTELPDRPKNKCPGCGASEDSIEGEKLTIDQDGKAKAKYRCKECGETWEEEGMVTESGSGRGNNTVDWDEIEDYRNDAHTEWGKGNDLDGEVAGNNNEQDQMEKGQTPSEMESKKDEMKQEWKRRMTEAAESARMQGKLPAGMDRIIENVNEPKLDWKSLIRRAISHSARNDYTYNRPRERYDLVYPTLRNPKVKVALALDTSGSIRGDELDKLMSEVKGITTSFESYKLLLMAGDTQIETEVVATTEQEIEKFEKNIKGGGGTDYRPFFERTKEENDIDVMVLLGDSYGEMPKGTYNFETIWVFTTADHKEVPFGKTCVLDGNAYEGSR